MAIALAGVFIAVGSAQLSDFLTFVRLVALDGRVAEANPLVDRVGLVFGLPGLIAAKVLVVAIVVSTFAILSRRDGRLAALVATVGTLAGLLGAASNVLAAR